MKPDFRLPSEELRVHGRPVPVSLDAARLESKRFNEEVVGGCYIVVHEKRD